MLMPIKKNKISFTLDLSEKIQKVPYSKRKEVTEQIGLALIDSINDYTGRGVSPVSKGQYKKSLSKDYKKATGKTVANLYEDGDMLGDLQIDNFTSKVTIKITQKEQKLKSYNHNVGDTLPVRKFIPDDTQDEKFKPSIMKRVNEIIDDASKD